MYFHRPAAALPRRPPPQSPSATATPMPDCVTSRRRAGYPLRGLARYTTGHRRCVNFKPYLILFLVLSKPQLQFGLPNAARSLSERGCLVPPTINGNQCRTFAALSRRSPPRRIFPGLATTSAAAARPPRCPCSRRRRRSLSQPPSPDSQPVQIDPRPPPPPPRRPLARSTLVRYPSSEHSSFIE